MTLLRSVFGVAILFFSTQILAQKKDLKSLKVDIVYLASDELEGRLAGSESEKVAAQYIKERFEKIGLTESGEKQTFYHDFVFNTPIKEAPKGNYFSQSGNPKSFKKEEDYYVVPISGTALVEGEIVDVSFGITAPELAYDNYEDLQVSGKIALLNLSSPDGIHPHSKYKKYHSWRERVDNVISKGAIAVLVYNSSEALSLNSLRAFTNLSRVAVPVMYLEESALEKLNKDKKVRVSTRLIQDKKTSRNVVAYLEGNSDKTVFVGAHFDHLGYGEYGNSRYIGAPQIHNGADDNASGVAMMLALAQRLEKNKKELKHNYVFIAFSAEELGLLGSKAFVNSELFDKYNPTYMMNFDMVGRLNEENELGIYGTGTSTAWDSLITFLDTSAFAINRNPSGMGSSDHTSFYLNKVPSIHLFTGSHEDYHKPTDDEDKINYDGMLSVLNFAYELIMELDDDKGINYKKTKSGSSRKAPSFKVTLGIIPDYFGDEKGLKIDGVSPGKPAEKAGLEKGDIITKLGDVDVKDMMTYMTALGVFNKGDKTTVELLRDGKAVSLEIQF